MKILIINGSPKEDGNTSTALKIVEGELIRLQVNTNWIHLGKSLFTVAFSVASAKKKIDVFSKMIYATILLMQSFNQMAYL